MTVNLHLGDCLEVVPNIPAGSVDAIITDLPYGTTACKWDTIIPFDDLWAMVKHTLKPRGAFVTTASQPFTSALVMSNPDWFKYELIWKKTMSGGFVHAKNKPLKKHENILIFSLAVTIHENQSQNRMIYNPQKTQGKPFTRKVKSATGGTILHKNTKSNLDFIGKELKNEGDRYPISVIEIPNGNNKNTHPTQKPVALYEYLVKTYTNEGDTVLDLTMGSGTTVVACVNTGRKFIGIEKEPDYYAIAEKRIKQAQEARQLELM